MSNNYFIVSDIHGCLDEFNQLLKIKDENFKDHQFVIIGDLIDRGNDSLGVIRKCMELQKQGAIITRGNHDQMFLNWLKDAYHEQDIYYYNGGLNTIESFVGYELATTKNPYYLSDYIKKNFLDEIKFLLNLPYYHETDDYIFVHAGINYSIHDWRTDKNNMLWIREHFYLRQNKTGKTIVFGHTPTQFLNKDNSDNSIHIDHARNIVGIDGGCAYGGQLNGLVITNDRISSVAVKR